MMGPRGHVVEVLLGVERGLGVIGVGARQPVGRSRESPEGMLHEVEHEISVENRPLFLRCGIEGYWAEWGSEGMNNESLSIIIVCGLRIF